MDFSEKLLVGKYGSWVRVQVAFYDFLFMTASSLCPEHFRKTAIEEIAGGAWSDGSDIYETTIGNLEGLFSTPEKAWEAFLAQWAEYIPDNQKQKEIKVRHSKQSDDV